MDADDLPARLHAGRQPVRADRRADRADPAADRVPGRSPDVARPMGMEVYSVDSVTAADPDGDGPRVPAVLSLPPRQRSRGGPAVLVRHSPTGHGGRTTAAPTSTCDLVDRDFDRGCRRRTPSWSCGRPVPTATCRRGSRGTATRSASSRSSPRRESLSGVRGTRRRRSDRRSRRGLHWRLISHLTPQPPVADGRRGRTAGARRSCLRLYDFSDPEAEPQLAAVTRQVDRRHHRSAEPARRRRPGRTADSPAGPS